jgi:hypothetical protein
MMTILYQITQLMMMIPMMTVVLSAVLKVVLVVDDFGKKKRLGAKKVPNLFFEEKGYFHYELWEFRKRPTSVI